jgi:hypothetical protein
MDDWRAMRNAVESPRSRAHVGGSDAPARLHHRYCGAM